MAEPTLLSDIIQPHWQSLTPEQRTCWHFWAAAHPQLDANGELRTLYGQQAHYAKNKNIAVTLTAPLLEDPPSNATPPAELKIYSRVWRNQARLADDITARGGLAYLELDTPLPDNVFVVIKQGYDRKRKGKGRQPRIRHVTTIPAGFSGTVSLTDPEGYFASTGGRPKFSFITGKTAARRRDKPLGTARVVNISNGEELRATLDNPFGGSRTGNNREKHEDPPTDAGHPISATYNSPRSAYVTDDENRPITS